MKKTFTDEQIVNILRGLEASGQTIKEYCRQKMSVKEHSISGALGSGQWKCPKCANTGSFSRKTRV